MGTEITTHSANAAELLSWPEWLTGKMMLVSDARRDARLPAEQRLSLPQENFLRARAAAIRQALVEEPDYETTISTVAKFLLTYSTANMGEAQAMAKSEAYFVALNDLPSWCVVEAVNRWHRGEVTSDVNYSFPTPPMLRAAALGVRASTEGRATVMERILKANEHAEQPPEVRASMLKRLAELFAGFSSKDREAA